MNARLLSTGMAVACLAALVLAAPAAAQQSGRRADPLAGLAAAVTMVTQEGLMLVESEFGVSNSRILKIGEEYRDGWKLEATTDSSATLKKGAETRTVAFAARAALPRTPSDAAAAGAAGQVNLSNAMAGERPKPGAPVDRAKVQAAITAGDIRQAFDLGGSAADVAAAMAARGGPMANMLANGGEAAFVNVGGRTGVRVASGDGTNNRVGIMVPRELEGVAPPADAVVMPPPPPLDGTENVVVGPNGERTIRRTMPLPAPE